MPRRRRDRTAYHAPNSVFGDPVQSERLAIANAVSLVGELTERERMLVIETQRLYSGRVFDLEGAVDELTAKLLEMYRVAGIGAA